jgi:dipeptide/tripeptide permease
MATPEQPHPRKLRERVAEHFKLMTKWSVAALGASGVLGFLAVKQVVINIASSSRHHHSVWSWVVAALVFLLIGELLTADEALEQKHASDRELAKVRGAT